MKWPRKFYDMELALLSLLLIGGCAWFSSKIDSPTNAKPTNAGSTSTASPRSESSEPSPTVHSTPKPTKKPPMPARVTKAKATTIPPESESTLISSSKVAPVTLARWGNAAHTVQACAKPYAGYCACALPYRPIWQSSLGYGCVLTFNWKWKDGRTRLTFRVDSTKHYVVPAGYPKAPDVCQEDKPIPYHSWCKNSEWHTPAGPIWDVKGTMNQKESNSYQRFVQYRPKTTIFVKTKPPNPDIAEGGFIVPCKEGTTCSFVRKIVTP